MTTKIIVADENTRVDASYLDKEKPKWVINSCRGRDHIDYKACRERSVKVKETDYASENSVADHAVALLLQLVVLNPKTQEKDGEEIKDKRVVIIGAGRIGQAIQKRMDAFGADTIFYDPYTTRKTINGAGVFKDKKGLNDLLQISDYCFLACPLTEENKKMIGYKEFFQLKDKVLINIARPELVDYYYLGIFASDGNDGGVRMGWDFANELKTEDWKVLASLLLAQARGDAVLTKHTAWRTREARERRERAIQEAKEEIKNSECSEAKASEEKAVRKAKEEIELEASDALACSG